MALGPRVPTWLALRQELQRLVDATGAHHASVLDAWKHLWCAAPVIEPLRQEEDIFIAGLVLKSLSKPLTRGGSVDRELIPEREGNGLVRSFAGVYLLMLRNPEPTWTTGVTDVSAWFDAVLKALPRIEALTLALPPPQGPGSGSAEGFGVA